MSTARARLQGLVRGRVFRGLALVLVVGSIGTGIAQTELDTRVNAFVPRGDKAYADLAEHDRTFGADPVVVLLHGTSAEGLLLDQTQLVRLVQLEGKLAQLPDVAVVYGPGTVLNQTAKAIQGVLAQIGGQRDGVRNLAMAKAKREGRSPAEIQAAGQAAVAKVDERYAKLLVQAMPMGLPTLGNPQFVASVLLSDGGAPRPEWRFLVPDAKSATLLVRPKADLSQERNVALVAKVRRTVAESGLEVSKPLITGAPVLASAIADKARSEAPRIGLAALAGVIAVFFLLPWSKRRRVRLLPLACALLGTATVFGVFGLVRQPLSLGVVAFLPILLGIGSDFPLYLWQPSHRRRVLAAAAAAAAAFAALSISPLPFVREFGLALTLGIVCTVGWALALRGFVREVEPHQTAHVRETPTRASARARGAAGIGAAAALLGWVALAGLPIQSSPAELAEGLPALSGVKEAEQILGFSAELDVVLRGSDVLKPDALSWSREAEEAVVTAHGGQMRPLLTFGRLLDFLGGEVTPEQLLAGAELVPQYLLDAAVAPDRGQALSTYGVRLEDVRDQADLIQEVRDTLPTPPAGYEADVVGIPVLAARSLELMSADRYLINLGGIVVAGVVLGGLLRSRRDGLVAVLAAGLASGWVFGAIWLLDIKLSPLTLAVGALITVTACEFTTMMSETRGEHVGWTRRSVAVAATAGTVGYAALALSELALLRDFGLTLAAGVASSYVAARLVTTAWPSRAAEAMSVTAAVDTPAHPEIVEELVG